MMTPRIAAMVRRDRPVWRYGYDMERSWLRCPRAKPHIVLLTPKQWVARAGSRYQEMIQHLYARTALFQTHPVISLHTANSGRG